MSNKFETHVFGLLSEYSAKKLQNFENFLTCEQSKTKSSSNSELATWTRNEQNFAKNAKLWAIKYDFWPTYIKKLTVFSIEVS